MADPFRKVQAGEPLAITAETFNAFVDTARDHRSRQQDRQRAPDTQFRQTGIVLVKNSSGEDRNRFDVLGIDRPIFTPSESILGFLDQVAFEGVVPHEECHAGKFVVLLEPLASGRIGRACISGVCHVRLSIVDGSQQYADVQNEACDSLVSAENGSAFILWKEGGEYGGNCYDYGYGYGYGDIVWAIVRLSNRSSATDMEWGTV